MVGSSIYMFKVIRLPVENNHATKHFIRRVDEFTTPAAGDNLFNFTRFMTDFIRHSTGIQHVILMSLTGEFPQNC
jgi:hypothetical protein